MKKIVLAVATLAMLAPAAFAANNSDDDKRMRQEFMMQTQKMIDDQMATIAKMNDMLTSYQKQLKMMMENEMNSQGGNN